MIIGQCSVTLLDHLCLNLLGLPWQFGLSLCLSAQWFILSNEPSIFLDKNKMWENEHGQKPKKRQKMNKNKTQNTQSNAHDCLIVLGIMFMRHLIRMTCHFGIVFQHELVVFSLPVAINLLLSLITKSQQHNW